ncbi:hypothetical protein XAP6164_3440005 [Xanthomonas phaseoli pv. phaseoli]|uniref:Uncharacterized protein n=1 Tax=Xanthomonas campestris pv. phaseoli TaxID=317013 RepID=A0ABY1TPV0_XANCH|nr:hypothetical protein XAP6984_270089 [Xanthomonas phaseoli pv. phaseoli]SOO29591.1 hypothetical protein XAP6164_3440005 [Xanthomonas phaseoli pv. phaseoli]
MPGAIPHVRSNASRYRGRASSRLGNGEVGTRRVPWQDAKAAKRSQERNRKHAIGLVGNIMTAKAAGKMRQDSLTVHRLCTATRW